MTRGDSFADSSQGIRQLIRLMQSLNFGRVTFAVRSGAPDFTQKVRTVRTVKLPAGDDGPRPEVSIADFELRKEVMSLHDQVAAATDGARVIIQVKYGLPFLVEIEQEHPA